MGHGCHFNAHYTSGTYNLVILDKAYKKFWKISFQKIRYLNMFTGEYQYIVDHVVDNRSISYFIWVDTTSRHQNLWLMVCSHYTGIGMELVLGTNVKVNGEMFTLVWRHWPGPLFPTMPVPFPVPVQTDIWDEESSVNYSKDSDRDWVGLDNYLTHFLLRRIFIN